MPVTKIIISLVCFFVTLASLGIYWFNINLWQDQAVLIFSSLGSLLNGICGLYFGFKIFSAEKGKALSTSLMGLFNAILFLINMAIFIFCVWQKAST